MSELAGAFRDTPGKAYLAKVITVLRLAKIVFLLLLAFATVSLVVGLVASGTGLLEKAVLLALLAGCVFLATKVSALATSLQARLQRL